MSMHAFQSPSVLVDMWGGWWWCSCCCLALGTKSSALLIFVNHFLTNNTANSRKIRGRIVGVDGWMDRWLMRDRVEWWVRELLLHCSVLCNTYNNIILSDRCYTLWVGVRASLVSSRCRRLYLRRDGFTASATAGTRECRIRNFLSNRF